MVGRASEVARRPTHVDRLKKFRACGNLQRLAGDLRVPPGRQRLHIVFAQISNFNLPPLGFAGSLIRTGTASEAGTLGQFQFTIPILIDHGDLIGPEGILLDPNFVQFGFWKLQFAISNLWGGQTPASGNGTGFQGQTV
eukprot:1195261-Prorocentrum_minimum.AAC.1